jgi:hypothetical protein
MHLTHYAMHGEVTGLAVSMPGVPAAEPDIVMQSPAAVHQGHIVTALALSVMPLNVTQNSRRVLAGMAHLRSW